MPTKRERGRPRHDDTLTPAEWRIVDAVRHGMTSRMIAQRRGISIDAVKFHVANALSKLDLANRAELRRWNGVSRSTLLHGKDPDMATASPIGRIGQISRTVTDLKAAETWYRDVLGLTHLYTFGDLAFFDCDGTRLFLSQSEAAPQHESILYFQVADIRASHAGLAARGISFTNAPHMIHRHANGAEEWLATFTDNEGRPLAIMAQVEP